MATRGESNVVYAAGLVQGVALVTFPAASSVFLDPSTYGLTSTQYGWMFLPQVVLAIIASLLGANLATRFGAKRLLRAGLAGNLVAMILLVFSRSLTSDQTVAYAVLLVATGFLGAGFGLAVPALNTFAAVFHEEQADRAVLTLNALSSVSGPRSPRSSSRLRRARVLVGTPGAGRDLSRRPRDRERAMALDGGVRHEGERARVRVPSRFWLFAAFALLYGVAETMNGNWAEVDMTRNLGASPTTASIALTAFWGMVTVGRVLFAAMQDRFPTSRAYHLLPFVLAAAFVVVALLPEGAPRLGVVAFGIAGLGCSALLPLTISFAQEQLATIAASVAGGVIAFYQVGYGFAALGTGPLVDAGVSLSAVFGATAVVALALGALSFALAPSRTAGARPPADQLEWSARQRFLGSPDSSDMGDVAPRVGVVKLRRDRVAGGVADGKGEK
jgi:MFS family permease